jgi:hypothetical protein
MIKHSPNMERLLTDGIELSAEFAKLMLKTSAFATGAFMHWARVVIALTK